MHRRFSNVSRTLDYTIYLLLKAFYTYSHSMAAYMYCILQIFVHCDKVAPPPPHSLNILRVHTRTCSHIYLTFITPDKNV
jgi:hypothetical protein